MQFQWREGIKGLLVGAGLGAVAGLTSCFWLFDSDGLSLGASALIGALICGVAGFLWGDDFFEWLKEYWYWWI